MDLWELGIINKLNRELFFIPGSEKCLKKKEKAAKEVPIKLIDLSSAFLILGIGLGLAVLCFLLELIVAKYQKEMNLRRSKPIIRIQVIPKPKPLKVVKLKTQPPKKLVGKLQTELGINTTVIEMKSAN